MTLASISPIQKISKDCITNNIRIADTDAGGHINNTILEAYVGNGRVARLRLETFNRARGKRWIITHPEINFDAEAEPPVESVLALAWRQ